MPKNLIFKGGGVKGIAYVGVLAALELASENFNFAEIERVGGTSAGAIIALAFALRLTAQELKSVLSGVDLDAMLDNKRWRERIDSVKYTVNKSSKFGLASYGSTSGASIASSASSELSEHLGFFPGKKLRDVFEKMLVWKTGIQNCTFAELRAAGFKDLHVIGFNLSTKLAETFCVDRTPNVIIADAIRISMSIPFAFQPHSVYEKDADGRRTEIKRGVWIDGGVMENYPIRLFDAVAEQHSETLGFYLSKGDKAAYLQGEQEVPPAIEIKGIRDFTFAVLSALMGHDYNDQVRYEDRNRTVIIDTSEDERSKNVETMDFNLSPNKQNGLMQVGWSAVRKFYSLEEQLPQVLPEKFHAIIIDGLLHDRLTCLAPETMNIHINFQEWAIAVAICQDNPEQVFFLMEGQNDVGASIFFRYDYVEQQVKVYEEVQGYDEHKAPRVLASLLKGKLQNTRGISWQLNKEVALDLQDKIRTMQNSKHENSAQWCLALLREIDDFQISGSLPSNTNFLEKLKPSNETTEVFTFNKCYSAIKLKKNIADDVAQNYESLGCNFM